MRRLPRKLPKASPGWEAKPSTPNTKSPKHPMQRNPKSPKPHVRPSLQNAQEIHLPAPCFRVWGHWDWDISGKTLSPILKAPTAPGSQYQFAPSSTQKGLLMPRQLQQATEECSPKLEYQYPDGLQKESKRIPTVS